MLGRYSKSKIYFTCLIQIFKWFIWFSEFALSKYITAMMPVFSLAALALLIAL
jgi:hypothetical protein